MTRWFVFFLVLGTLCRVANAQLETLLDNGPASNRVDIVFLGDGYTASDLGAGTYDSHVSSYLGYLFDASSALVDPFPRYKNFFNAHAIEVVSNESGADKPSLNVFVDTALDATYESSGIDRLLTVKNSSANAIRTAGLAGTGITADMQIVTVNDTKYGGSGGSWATFAGGNSSAHELALHESGHSFSRLADEYVSYFEPYPFSEPMDINVTTDSSGAKWSHWLGFDDPRGSNLDIGVFEGANFYETGIYRPSFNSKMRSLGRAFDAVSREKIILDIYEYVDPIDDWLDNSVPVEGAELWVDVVDPEVIHIEWFVDGVLVPTATDSSFVATDHGFGAGTYTVVAHAYDTVLDHVGDGSLLDLVRRDFDQLEQELEWTIVVDASTIPGDFSGDEVVDGEDLPFWQAGFGRLLEATPFDGDADEDQDVDGQDFLVWQRNATTSSTLLATVPEPTSMLLAIGCIVLAAAQVRRLR